MRDTAERRLGVRHGLAPGHWASDPLDAACRVVGLHGTDPASAYLAVHARVPGAATADLGDEFYGARRLLRVLAMRRTVFLVPADLRLAIQASTLPRVANAHRNTLLKDLAGVGIADPGGGWTMSRPRPWLLLLGARGLIMRGRPSGSWYRAAVLEDIGSEAMGQVEAAAASTAAFLGRTRFTPSFRTPTERRLSA